MITILIIFLVAFFKSIADTIRVPARFNATYFARFSTNKWVNPEISWINQYKGWAILKPIISMFSDLWHTCNTIMISLFLLLAYLYQFHPINDNFIVSFLVYWAVYGYSFEWWLGIWSWLKPVKA